MLKYICYQYLTILILYPFPDCRPDDPASPLSLNLAGAHMARTQIFQVIENKQKIQFYKTFLGKTILNRCNTSEFKSTFKLKQSKQGFQVKKKADKQFFSLKKSFFSEIRKKKTFLVLV